MKTFLSLFLGCISHFAIAQQQVGSSVCGTTTYAYFGQSVKMSADGLRMVASGQGYGNLVSARVLQFTDGEWVNLGTPFQNTNSQNSFVMVPVSCDAGCNRVVYSDVYNDESGTDRGKVVVRELQGTDWVPLGNAIFGEHNGELSGSALDMSADGTRIVVGSNRNDANGNDAGKVKVYELQSGVWTQMGNDIVGTAAGNYFGTAVVISPDGNRIACGAPFNSNLATRAGTVTIYDFVAGQWQLIAQINGTAADERFGGALSFNQSAGILAVGCDKLYGPGGGQNLGVEIYEYQGGSWNQLGNSIPGEIVGDYFGAALALSPSGNALAIGAPQFQVNGTAVGYAKVFQLNSQTWNQVGSTFTGSSDGNYDNVGFALSFSQNGKLAIGSPFLQASGKVGCVNVYDLNNVLSSPQFQSEDDLEIWPNPTQSLLHIANAAAGTKFILRDISAKKLIETNVPSLDLGNLAPGIYLLEVIRENRKVTKKIIRQ